MQVVTTFRQMPASDALREYAEQKLHKLEKYNHGIIEARVAIFAGKTSQGAEVTIKADGFLVRGEETAADAYSAVDLVMDKLARQLRKHHDKEKSHKAQSARREFDAEAPKGEDFDAEARADAPSIVSRVTYPLKPLFPDDAVARMEQNDDHFMVFVNADSNTVNAIYRRSDGNYGLVEPDR